MSTKPRVVHCKIDKFDVYIGRPSVWGNPYSHKAGTLAKFRVGTVEEAVSQYAEWLCANPELIQRARQELKGKVLGCWCKTKKNPEALCHGDILENFANSAIPEHVVRCSFQVGECGDTYPIDLLWKQASPAVSALASDVVPNKAICIQCKDAIGRDELFGQDLRKLTCPSCYSSNILMVEARFILGYIAVDDGERL